MAGIIRAVLLAQVRKAVSALVGDAGTSKVRVDHRPRPSGKPSGQGPNPWGMAPRSGSGSPFQGRRSAPAKAPSSLDARERAMVEAGREGEVRVREALDAAGWRHADDLMIPRETGHAQLDHVVLCGSSLVVIETKFLAGTVLGTGLDERWVQRREGQPDRAFYSPLEQNQVHVDAARQVAATTVPIYSMVVVVGNARLEVRDRRVVRLEGMQEALRAIQGAGDPRGTDRARNAFEFLTSVAAKVDRPTAEAWHVRNARAAEGHAG